MEDKKKSDALNVVEALLGDLSMEDSILVITKLAHDNDIPILMCHMQSDSGEIKTPLNKKNFEDKDLQMRFTVFGFPKKIMDKTVSMLIGQSVDIISYKGDVSVSPTMPLDALDGNENKKNKKDKNDFNAGKRPKGW